ATQAIASSFARAGTASLAHALPSPTLAAETHGGQGHDRGTVAGVYRSGADAALPALRGGGRPVGLVGEVARPPRVGEPAEAGPVRPRLLLPRRTARGRQQRRSGRVACARRDGRY